MIILHAGYTLASPQHTTQFFMQYSHSRDAWVKLKGPPLQYCTVGNYGDK